MRFIFEIVGKSFGLNTSSRLLLEVTLSVRSFSLRSAYSASRESQMEEGTELSLAIARMSFVFTTSNCCMSSIS